MTRYFRNKSTVQYVQRSIRSLKKMIKILERGQKVTQSKSCNDADEDFPGHKKLKSPRIHC